MFALLCSCCYLCLCCLFVMYVCLCLCVVVVLCVVVCVVFVLLCVKCVVVVLFLLGGRGMSLLFSCDVAVTCVCVVWLCCVV